MAAIGHPIVGDAKYGGPEAFLTGGISRKLHLHARRIRIDAPDGGAIDVTAELPPHFAESLATLGLRADGRRDACRSTSPIRPSRPKRSSASVAAAAKSRRRERRGRARELARAVANGQALMHPNRAFAWEDRGRMLRLRRGARLRAHLHRRGRRAVRRPCAGVVPRGPGAVPRRAPQSRSPTSSPAGRVLISVVGPRRLSQRQLVCVGRPGADLAL